MEEARRKEEAGLAARSADTEQAIAWFNSVDALKKEIYTTEGFGTMIVREKEKKKYITEETQK